MKRYKTTTPEFQLKKIKTDFPKAKIQSSADAAEFIRQFYSDDIGIFESFFILLLNRVNTTSGYAKISQGGIAGTVADVRIIAKYAVDAMACSVILAHNHPTGTLVPSEADKNVTKKVTAALQLLDVRVIDHLILTEDSHFSFADEGLL